MIYEEYEKDKLKEGQKLVANGKPCTFVEHDECHGVIWVRYDGDKKDKTTPIECVEIVDESKNNLTEDHNCGNCHKCLEGKIEDGMPVVSMRMILCPECGNKRCPKASDHTLFCTQSNEPDQKGSVYSQNKI